jgi:uncharacterized protein
MKHADQSYLTIDDARALYAQGDAAHDFDHVLRVTQLATQIAAAEGADQTVVRLAALLHDAPVDNLAGVVTDTTVVRSGHHRAAAAFAGEYLRGRGLAEERIANVVHCIAAHRFRDSSVQPQTPEAKCLYDADKLDSIGAIGVARAFAYAGAHANRLWTMPHTAIDMAASPPSEPDYTPVHEYVYKLHRILETLHTDTARAIGARRHVVMQQFFEQLDQEMT